MSRVRYASIAFHNERQCTSGYISAINSPCLATFSHTSRPPVYTDPVSSLHPPFQALGTPLTTPESFGDPPCIAHSTGSGMPRNVREVCQFWPPPPLHDVRSNVSIYSTDDLPKASFVISPTCDTDQMVAI
jgi:hypothetical protein